jgi:hypothetical protein
VGVPHSTILFRCDTVTNGCKGSDEYIECVKLHIKEIQQRLGIKANVPIIPTKDEASALQWEELKRFFSLGVKAGGRFLLIAASPRDAVKWLESYGWKSIIEYHKPKEKDD